MIDEVTRRLKEDLRLVEAIHWRSVEKDNMEFEARITCFQKEALSRLLERIDYD